MIPEKKRLIDFLLFRRDSKKVILSVIKSALMPGQQLGLATIAQMFDKFNTVCRSHLDFQQQSSTQFVEGAGKPIPVHFYNGGRILIQQPDLYTHVLSPCAENKEIPYKFIVAVLVEYIRSLNQYHIPVQTEDQSGIHYNARRDRWGTIDNIKTWTGMDLNQLIRTADMNCGKLVSCHHVAPRALKLWDIDS
ncbi:hypothetical protein BSL78_07391 [Apostichopus japonicus]|uniref:Mic1 domain-containing protein n=1 Tax=Stichopus japonicus TaxID=307972 RepID=A0A2G8L671_STIJA|nr:hypothetical protein BSL78_07391 [Apostichopus japonicus]